MCPILSIDVFDVLATLYNDHSGMKIYYQLLAIPKFGRRSLQPSSQKRYQTHFVHDHSYTEINEYEQYEEEDDDDTMRAYIYHIKYLPHASLNYEYLNKLSRMGKYLHSPPGSEKPLPSFIVLNPQGQKTTEQIYYNGELHCSTAPACINYYTSKDSVGRIEIEEWLLNGEYHRDNGPARITYYESGNTNCETWYQHGERHGPDGGTSPACINYSKSGKVISEVWYQHGKVHRSLILPSGRKAPASITYRIDGTIEQEEWFQDDKRHCTDEPAFIQYYEPNKIHCEKWYQKGKLHREDGPAYISYKKSGKIRAEEWYQRDKLHRENGPARTRLTGGDEYYYNNKKYSKADYKKKMKKIQLSRKQIETTEMILHSLEKINDRLDNIESRLL
jgi:antitoxin component YwqK of YwqJK toxin-antitoxin module